MKLRLFAIGMLVMMTMVAMPAVAEQVEAKTGTDVSWASPIGSALATGCDGDIAVKVGHTCASVVIGP